MIRRMVFAVSWSSTVLVCALGGAETYAVLHPAPRARGQIQIPPLAIAPTPLPNAAAHDSALGAIIEGNLFRRDRSPAVVTAQPAASPPKAIIQRPHLELRGLMGGPPWQVLLDGVPGHQSSVLMRVGQSIGGITVTAVNAGTVVLNGADTIWQLTLRK